MKRSSLILFLLIILLSVCLRTILIIEKRIIKYDDAISYLTATGHRGEYDLLQASSLPPIGEWVDASEWKRFVQVEQGAAFQQIAYDMAHSGLHPPLYFWLLHVWIRFLGATPWTGPLLNIVFDLVTALTILFFGLRYLEKPREAILASSIWLLSPVAIHTSAWIRHYSLFTLVGLLFSCAFYAWLYAPKSTKLSVLQYLALVLVTAAGLLTHYLFSLFVFAAAALIALKALRLKEVRRIAQTLLVVAIAGALFWLLHPDFAATFGNYGSKLSESDLRYRLARAFSTSLLLFSPLLLATALAILAGFSRSGPLSAPSSSILALFRRELSRQLVIWTSIITLALWAIVTMLYLVGQSPRHAMGTRHLSSVGPFIAYLSVFLLRLVGRQPKRWAFLLWAGILAMGIVAVLPAINDLVQNRVDVTALHRADLVVLDNASAGTWPGIVLHLQDGSEVFVADQADLQVDVPAWLPKFCKEGGLFVSYIRGQGSTVAARQKIVDTIHRQCDLSLVSEAVKSQGTIAIYERP